MGTIKMIFIDYKADIISGKSLANIQIGKNIEEYLQYIHTYRIKFEIKKYNENKKNEIHSYLINENILVNTFPNGKILNISALNYYEGTLNKKIKSGMTVKQIKNNSENQRINNGCLFINNDYGFCYCLPSPYNEITDNIKNLPNNLVLNEIVVDNLEWWFKPNLIPEYAK
jgi:hypothetical protein